MFCLLTNAALQAQSLNFKDSLVQHLAVLPESNNKISLYLKIAKYTFKQENKPKIARLWADSAFRLAKKTGNSPQLMYYWETTGSFYRKTTKFPQALDCYNKALKIAEALGDSASKASILNQKATTFRWSDNYEKAVINYFHAEKLAKIYKQDQILLYVYNGLGNSYTILKNFDMAMSYYEKALKMAAEQKNQLSIAINLNNIGEIYEQKMNLDEAEKFYEESLRMNLRLKNEIGIAISNRGIGNLAYKKGSYQEALAYYKKAYILNKKRYNYISLAQLQISIGKTQVELNNLDTALVFLNKGLVIAEKFDSKLAMKEAYLALATLYQKTEQHKAAYGMLKKFAKVSSTLYDRETANTVSLLQVQYNIQQYQNELSLLKEKNESLALKKNRNRLIYSGLGIIVLAIIIIFYSWKRGEERKQKQIELAENNALIENMNKNLSAENEIRKNTEAKLKDVLAQKEVLISEIHHRVKNNLAMVSGLLHLELSKLTDEKSRWILSNTNNRIQAIKLIHENIYHSEKDAKVDFSKYTEIHVRKIIDSLNTNTALKTLIYSDTIYLGLHQAVPVSLIIKELVTNVIHHAFTTKKTEASRLTVKLLEDKEKNIVLTVTDNGSGIKGELNINKVESAGFLIVSIFVKQLKGEFATQSSEKGTVHTLKFKQSIMKVWK